VSRFGRDDSPCAAAAERSLVWFPNALQGALGRLCAMSLVHALNRRCPIGVEGSAEAAEDPRIRLAHPTRVADEKRALLVKGRDVHAGTPKRAVYAPRSKEEVSDIGFSRD